MERTGLVILTTLLPISELRGGIPLGIALGLDPLSTFLIAVSINSMLFFPIFLGLKLLYSRFLSRLSFFHTYLERVRTRGKPWIDRYGYFGLTLFVGIPLPMTGVYTGTALAWLLNMELRKAFLCIGLGVIMAGIIVLLTTLGVITGVESLFLARGI